MMKKVILFLSSISTHLIFSQNKELTLSPSKNIDGFAKLEKPEKPAKTKVLSDDSDESRGSSDTLDLLDNLYNSDIIKNDGINNYL